MTEVGTILTPDPTEASLPFEVMPPTFTRQVVSTVLSSTGARTGLLWVGVLVFCAIFAPFIANTHPLLMKEGGHWSSPVLKHLTSGDVSLLLVFFSAVLFYAWPGRQNPLDHVDLRQHCRHLPGGDLRSAAGNHRLRNLQNRPPGGNDRARRLRADSVLAGRSPPRPAGDAIGGA